MYAQDSIELLTKSGIDFKEHQARGIDVSDFGEILMTSGIVCPLLLIVIISIVKCCPQVLNEDIRWISFHSGYDYGYLLKVCLSFVCVRRMMICVLSLTSSLFILPLFLTHTLSVRFCFSVSACSRFSHAKPYPRMKANSSSYCARTLEMSSRCR